MFQRFKQASLVGAIVALLFFGFIPSFGQGGTAITVVNASPSTGPGTAGSSVSFQMVRGAGSPTFAGAGFTLSGTWVGTLQPQYSVDLGVTWKNCSTFDANVPATINTTETTNITNQTFLIPGGTTNVRVTCTAYTSGTATVSIQGSAVASNFAYVIAGGGGGGGGSNVAVTNTPSVTNYNSVSSSVGTAAIIYSNTALTNTVVAVKSSAGKLFALRLINTNAAVVYVQLFNVGTGSVTLGSTAPTQVVAVPPGSTASPGFYDMYLPAAGSNWSTAISAAATTTSTGSTAPGTAVIISAEII